MISLSDNIFSSTRCEPGRSSSESTTWRESNSRGAVSPTTHSRMDHLLVYSKFESLIEKIVEKATSSRLDRLVDIARQMQLCWENSQATNVEGYWIASILVKRIETEVNSCKKIRVLYAISAVLRKMNARRGQESHEMPGEWAVSFGRFCY